MSHSLQILEIMYGYIVFVCRICDAGYEARADVVDTTSCKKLVVDMHYEA
jgi:predicted metal-binding protein